ncbi:ACT_7 domain-containing protein [Pseudozyma hubeiensis]|nr:ACT_7 domain-containing protein [Pseudozyma hubeiensis]
MIEGTDINDKTSAQAWQSRKSSYPNLDVLIQPDEYMLARLPPASSIPQPILDLLSAPTGSSKTPFFCTVSRTQNELSILVSTAAERSWSNLKVQLAPSDRKGEEDGYGTDGPWRAFRIRGPMQFHLVGVLLEFSKCLAQRDISIFAVSTWDTDYICVKQSDFEDACKALTEDGWNVVDQDE